MALEETVNVPCLPKKEYENPVTVKLGNNKLIVSYSKGWDSRINHYFGPDGRPSEYIVERRVPYPKNVMDSFVNSWIKEKHGIDEYLSKIDIANKKEIVNFLYEHNDDFRQKYSEIIGGYYQFFEMVTVIENEPKLYNEEFYEILMCNRIIIDLVGAIQGENLKSSLITARGFDHRLLLPCRNNLFKNKQKRNRN